MTGVGIFGAIIIGILAGWFAERSLGRSHGLLTNLIVGVIGSFLGAALFSTLGINVQAGWIGSLIVSSVGAVVLLFLLGLLRR